MLPAMNKRTIRCALLIPFLISGSLFTGCEGGSFSFPWRVANTEKIQEEIRSMNPRELDLCRMETGAAGTSSSASGNALSGGGSTQADANAWNSQVNVESQLLGDGGPATQQAPAPSGGSASSQNSGITSFVVKQRADPSYATIVVSPSSSKLATMTTTGFARITRFNTNGRRATEVVDENAEVSLVYNLSKNSGSWRCVSVSATPIGSGPPPQGGKPSNSSGRIGW